MKRKSNSLMNTMFFSVLIGTLSALILTFIGAVICSYMLNHEKIGENSISLFACAIWFVSSLVGTLVSSRLKKDKIISSVLITVVAYILILIGVKIIVYDAPFYRIGQGILAIFIGLIPCVFLSANQKSRKKIKFKYSP